jgi:VIT1/CCC1 family predicted Fe2+/Mn2+ transporter
MNVSQEVRQKLLAYQRSEITEHHIYARLAGTIRSPENRQVLEHIAEDELRHYQQWRGYTQQEVGPDRWSVWKYYLISRVLGFTFGAKLMEKAEGDIQGSYEQLKDVIPEADAIMHEEQEHEKTLLQMLDEERLRYTGSIVLGLNDALVELTGALAGFTLALGSTRVISLAGLITGISAAFSMAASDYLSTKAEGDPRAAKSAVYTGVAYLATVVVLILPFLLLSNKFLCLGITLAVAIGVIWLFNYYLSVAKDVQFKRRFLEMGAISLGVAAFSFFIGFVLKKLLGVEA